MRYLVNVNTHLGGLAIDMGVINAIDRTDKDSHIEVFASPPYHTLLSENPKIAKLHVRSPRLRVYCGQLIELIYQSWDIVLQTRRNPKIQLLHLFCRAKVKRTMRMNTPLEPPSEMLARLSLLEGILPSWQEHVDPTIHFNTVRVVDVFTKYDIQQEAKLLAIAPGASIPEKIWHKDKYVELIQQLQNDYDEVLIFGSDNELELCKYIATRTQAHNIAGQLGILDVCALLSKVNLFVGNDSGLAHIAAGLGRSCLMIGGHDLRYCPWGQHQLLGRVIDISAEDVMSQLVEI